MSRYKLTKREKKANRVGTFAFGGFLTLILILVLVLPQFYVSTIDITGSRVVTRGQIISIGNLKTGFHLFNGVNGSIKQLFQLRHAKSEQLLKENLTYIRNVEIESVFPSMIKVNIDERIEVAYVAINDGCVIIDSEGIVLEVLNKSDSRGIPVIEGVVANQIQCGHKASVDLPDSLNESIVLLNDIINADKDTRVDVKLLPEIKTIRPIQDKLLFLTLLLPGTNEELIVKVKNSNENADKMVWLRFALKQGKLGGKGKGILDLSSTQKVFIPER